MGASYELIARVGKARGLEGKVTASLAAGLPFCLREGLRCHVVPPTLYGPRVVHIASVEELGGDQLLLSFDEVDTIDAADQMAGRSLLADVEDLDLEDELDWLVGCEVEDERYGFLGEVTELLVSPANDVLVVEGPYGEVLVPVVEDALASFPEEEGEPVRTHLMDGLVEDGGPAEGEDGA